MVQVSWILHTMPMHLRVHSQLFIMQEPRRMLESFHNPRDGLFLQKRSVDMGTGHLRILWKMHQQHKMTERRSEDWNHIVMDSLPKEKQVRILADRMYTG